MKENSLSLGGNLKMEINFLKGYFKTNEKHNEQNYCEHLLYYHLSSHL